MLSTAPFFLFFLELDCSFVMPDFGMGARAAPSAGDGEGALNADHGRCVVTSVGLVPSKFRVPVTIHIAPVGIDIPCRNIYISIIS